MRRAAPFLRIAGKASTADYRSLRASCRPTAPASEGWAGVPAKAPAGMAALVTLLRRSLAWTAAGAVWTAGRLAAVAARVSWAAGEAAAAPPLACPPASTANEHSPLPTDRIAPLP